MYWLEVCNNEEVKRLNEVTIACFQDDIKLLVENKSDLPKLERTLYKLKGAALCLDMDDLTQAIIVTEYKIMLGQVSGLKQDIDLLAVMMRDKINLLDKYQS
ncbi:MULTISPECIES: hypothetical protein [unclassified Vibrio]|uniref:hypothetical protein n=1 Tax=unclassified Vibrio TaxID=2614977 RepID=UPI0011101ACE|nr:hypothetical protein [Vibrio sp. Hep-1b-8]TMX34092.1 hypothetical protein DA100_16315 [Vibrio sp. Hep-1b-8]